MSHQNAQNYSHNNSRGVTTHSVCTSSPLELPIHTSLKKKHSPINSLTKDFSRNHELCYSSQTTHELFQKRLLAQLQTSLTKDFSRNFSTTHFATRVKPPTNSLKTNYLINSLKMRHSKKKKRLVTQLLNHSLCDSLEKIHSRTHSRQATYPTHSGQHLLSGRTASKLLSQTFSFCLRFPLSRKPDTKRHSNETNT